MAEMADFNIQTLAHFLPPDHLCQKCLALLLYPMRRGETWKCPVCSVEYTSRKDVTSADHPYHVTNAAPYLKARGLALEFDNLLEHCKALAEATLPGSWDVPNPPLRALLQTISLAKHFIHFTSFGIGDFFIGALKLVAQRISVRGVVSNVDGERMLDELTAFNDEVPYGSFEIKHFLREGPWHEAPHQKLIVIDGLVAFKGSANLTLNGWRKATRGLDHVEIVTNVNEVIDLHNRLFSPVWASFSKVGAAIRIS